MLPKMDARRGLLDEFATATALLTRLPVGAVVAEEGAIAAAGWAFPLVGAGSGALPPLMRVLPPARADGLGAMAGTPGLTVALTAAALAACIAIALLGPGRGIIALLLAGIALALAAVLARRQIGGYTGDVLGFF